MQITSHANLRIKDIRRLRERKFRDEQCVFWVEGIRPVIQAAAIPDRVRTLVVAPDLLSSQPGLSVVESLRKAGCDILEVSADVFRDISAKDGPTGLAAIVNQTWLKLEKIDLLSHPFWVGLDQVADPGNLGTILRTADATGVDGVILIDNCTDPYEPGAVRASMGAIFSVRLVKSTWTEFLSWKQQSKTWMVGTSDKAQKRISEIPYPSPRVVLMGSEREGLPVDKQHACDEIVSIPMLGTSDSLNLAVATAVVLYEIVQQQMGRKEWRP